MRVCLLQSAEEEGGLKGAEKWLARHDSKIVLMNKATIVPQIRDLAKEGYDVFINLCDGAWDEYEAGLGVVLALERFNLPFTGASSAFYEPSKETMKMAAFYAGVDTPAFVFAYSDVDIEEAVGSLRFPVIVKHFNGYSSIGMTKDSKCADAAALRVQARKMIEAFGGALVEEFIEGREFTVLVAENPEAPGEPLTFVPVECAFPKGEDFKHYDLKWVDWEGLTWRRCVDAALDARLRDVGRRVFLALQGDGYARCDLRMDAAGNIFFLEINPNCGIFYDPLTPGSADCILLQDPITTDGFLDHIVRCAIVRHKARVAAQKTRLKFAPGRGYGIAAARDLAEGEVVEEYEGKAHYLVTRQHMDTRWTEAQRRMFAADAYPLVGDIHVAWSNRPAEWRPVLHGCEPNAWFAGLNLVARRAIRAGEFVTIDYATVAAANAHEKPCRCGAKACRGSVVSSDAQQAWVKERYGEHVSAFLKARLLSPPPSPHPHAHALHSRTPSPSPTLALAPTPPPAPAASQPAQNGHV